MGPICGSKSYDLVSTPVAANYRGTVRCLDASVPLTHPGRMLGLDPDSPRDFENKKGIREKRRPDYYRGLAEAAMLGFV
jgi:hypothetical protein